MSARKEKGKERPQHGVKGAYVGGDWVPIEECATLFNISGGSDETYKKHCLNNGNCATCPRSRTRRSAVKPDGTYDVIVIGAGCIGASIARELSKTMASVLVLESSDDVSQGATKGNSGIVHAGFDDTPGSVRAKFCWKGNQMFSQLDHELHFGYQRNGSLVLARNAEEVEHLKVLKERGEKNGVERLRIIEKEELFEMEPYVHPDCIAALYAPDAGNLIPYEFAIALAENAVDNGVELRIRRRVTAIQAPQGGEGLFQVTVDHWEPKTYTDSLQASLAAHKQNKPPALSPTIVAAVIVGLGMVLGMTLAGVVTKAQGFTIGVGLVGLFVGFIMLQSQQKVEEKKVLNPSIGQGTIGLGGRLLSVDDMKVGGSGWLSAVGGAPHQTETFRARFIVNCAGSGADDVSKMIGDESFKIKPRLGDYVLLTREQGHLATRTLFPCPGPLGKGVLVQTTLWGQLILGPTARDMHLPEVAAQKPEEIQNFIFSKCKQLVPSFEVKHAFHTFSGARAKSTRGDWIIEPSEKHPRFIQAAGIDSPGLAGAPAIALEVVRLLQVAGLETAPNPNFNPNRAPVIVPKDGWKGLKAGPPGKYTNPKENVVCKCEKVTEDEIVTALRRSLPIDSTQAIRKRTRAGMGHCQADPANYDCECRVAAIISRETGIPFEAVGRRPWPATSTLPQRWLTAEQISAFQALKDQDMK